MSDENRDNRGRFSLLLIAVVAAAPVVTAYILFHFWRPSAFTNYGQLLPPARIADVSIRQPDGSDFTLDALKGKWVLMMVDSGTCDVFCRRKLYQMRQVRLTQGKDMERIERAWLVDDEASPSGDLVAEYQGTRVVAARGSTLLSRLPADVSIRDHIYIVDPLGNLMMRYPRDADPSRIKKDVTRLLKVSGVG
jgi:cytochrome oxidase Cu insertion factor (SCO1/SenC/PrrC family)